MEKIVCISMLTLVLLIGSTPVMAGAGCCSYSQEQMAKNKADSSDGTVDIQKCIMPDLTDDQRSQLKKLKAKLDQEVAPQMKKLTSLKNDLQTLLTENASQKELEYKIDQIGSLKTDILKVRLNYFQDFSSQLDQKQKDQFTRFATMFLSCDCTSCCDQQMCCPGEMANCCKSGATTCVPGCGGEKMSAHACKRSMTKDGDI